tara:strand:+ start:1725 stop:2048 length:324 start_codon:yes stop_codon:yes gene_type:complete
MAKRKKPTYTWYLAPLDAHTNEVIAREADQRGIQLIPMRDILCSDGKTHNLWQCNYSFARFLFLSKDNLGIRCVFYSQQGRGKIDTVPNFVFKTKKKKLREKTRSKE